jgi:FtsH-binding integral membrane protein
MMYKLFFFLTNAIIYNLKQTMVLSSIFIKNTVQSQKGGGSGDITSLLVKNSGFLAKIFTNLLVQLAITYYVMENYPVAESFWFYFLGSLGLLFIIGSTHLPIWAKFFAFVLFSYMTGRLSAVLKKQYSEEMIRQAILGTMGVFAIMFIVGASVPILGYQFGAALFLSLLVLLVARIVSAFSDNNQSKWLSGAGIGIFGLYVAYDTNNILKRADYYQEDFITASADYYLDIINLVSDLLHFNR